MVNEQVAYVITGQVCEGGPLHSIITYAGHLLMPTDVDVVGKRKF